MKTPLPRALMGVALIASSLIALPARAQSTPAEVLKIDAAQGKLTLKHGEIRNLDMPPMTMVFRTLDKAMLDGLKPGARVLFDADRIDGVYTVTKIAPAP
jgi:Cu/Ag efflux protein CusF